MKTKMKRISSFLMATVIFYLLGVSYIAYAAPGDWDGAAASQIYKDTKLEELQAKAAILVDFNTGRFLFEKNADEQLSMASMTKLMTVLLLMDEMKQNSSLTKETILKASKKASETEGSKVWLKIGEEFTVEEALKAIFIHSANDVAMTVAEKIGGTEAAFVVKMNEKAKELNLTNTKYADPVGLSDDNHYSSARDMAMLAKHLISTYPEVLEYSKIRLDYFNGQRSEPFMLLATNQLIEKKFYNGVDGLKTGFTTKAGYCLTSTIKDPNDPENGRRVIAVVMGEPDVNTRAAESKKLLEHGLKDFEAVNVEKKGQFIKDVAIKNGVNKRVKASAGEDLDVLLEKGVTKDAIKKSISLDENIKAPIQKGDKLGEVIYKIGDNEVGRVSVLADEDMKKANGFILFIRKILSWFGLD